RDLDEARMREWTWAGGRLDYRGGAAKFAKAFTDYGLEVKPERAEELARRIRAEEPAVRDALIVALDTWTDFTLRANTGFEWVLLAAVAGAADDDAWRQKYRAAKIAGERSALRTLNDEARRLSVQPSSLLLLARALNRCGERDEALALLRWGRGRYHSDF